MTPAPPSEAVEAAVGTAAAGATAAIIIKEMRQRLLVLFEAVLQLLPRDGPFLLGIQGSPGALGLCGFARKFFQGNGVVQVSVFFPE